MKVIIAGLGKIGTCVVSDVVKWAKNVVVCDNRADSLNDLRRNNIHKILIRKVSDINALTRQGDILISCLPFEHNYQLTKICITNKTSMVDLGGSIKTTLKQESLNAHAKRNGVTIVPDCGLAPGLTNVLAGKLHKMNYRDQIIIRVGGLPLRPRSPSYYELLFSVDGLINEYVSKAIELSDHKIKSVKPLSDIGPFDMMYIFGAERKLLASNDLEIASTSGGTSTLPYSFRQTAGYINYKTIRYRGHYSYVRKAINKYNLRKLRSYLLSGLNICDNDLVMLVVEGRKGNKRMGYSLIHFKRNAYTAMMECTAYPASIVAWLIAGKKIPKKGVVRQELVVNGSTMISELKKRGIVINKYAFAAV